MASVRFVLKEPQKNVPNNEQKETLVYLLFSYNGKRLKLSTGKKILPQFWNEKEQRVKHTAKFPEYPEFNARLNQYTSTIHGIHDKLIVNGIAPTKERLKTEFNNAFNIKSKASNELNLNQYIDKFIKDIEAGNRLTDKKTVYSAETVRTFNDFRTAFNKYQSDTKKLNFDDITIDFYDDYIKYCNKKNNAPNTIGKRIKNLKTIMRAAMDEGLHNNVEIERKKFKVLRIETDQIYLSENELNKIYELDLSKEPDLEIARDLFLIGCYSAQRFSDFSKIKPENIREIGKNAKVINLIQQKTGERVTIPMHWRLEEILKKYDYSTPKILEQKLNERIKEIGKLAGINDSIPLGEIKGGLKVKKTVSKYKLIKTHTARRSGATNMYKAGIPTLDIMKITGHKTEREFLKYIRITKEETAEMLSNHEYFNRPPLKVVK